MNDDIRSKPVLRLLSGLVAGLSLNKCDIRLSLLLIIMLILLGGLWIHFSFRFARRPGNEWINGILIMAFYLIMGIQLKSVTANKSHAEETKLHGTFLAEVLAYPLQKEQTNRVEVIILSSNYTDTINTGKNVMVYFKNSDSLILPCISDIILFHGELCSPESPKNPGEFDYASYLRSKGISFTCFLDPGDWITTGRNNRFSLMITGLELREKIWMRISAVQPDNPNLDILCALTLGSKDLLDKETKEAFILTGTMHVLAVSGLHVGLIYMVISALLIFVRRLPGGGILFFFIVISFLWLYALITGMCPSVIRSVIMFSFVILGKTLRKETSVYNSVFLAGFLSLLCRPAWLNDPGFQLSYSAVLAIVFFQPRIFSVFSVKNRLLKWVWELLTVSIAAQLGTLPISLYYFHRFPPYFLMANLIVIPVVTVILAGFIVQLLSLFIPFVFTLVSKFILLLTGILNESVRIIGQLPSPGFENLFILKIQMWLFILIILTVVFFLLYRQKHWIIFNLILILFSVSVNNLRLWKRNTTDYFIVYHIPRYFAAGMYSSGNGIILLSSERNEDQEVLVKFKCGGFHGKYLLFRSEIIELNSLDYNKREFISSVRLPGKNNHLIWFMGKRILFLDDPSYFNYRRSNSPVEADIMVLGGKTKISREGYLNNFSCRMVILSSSIPDYINYDGFHYFFSGPAPLLHDVRISGAWMTMRRHIDNQTVRCIQNYLKSLGIL